MKNPLRFLVRVLGEAADRVSIPPDTRPRVGLNSRCPECGVTQLIGGPYGSVDFERDCVNCGATVTLQHVTNPGAP